MLMMVTIKGKHLTTLLFGFHPKIPNLGSPIFLEKIQFLWWNQFGLGETPHPRPDLNRMLLVAEGLLHHRPNLFCDRVSKHFLWKMNRPFFMVIFNLWGDIFEMVLMLEEEEDLQAKPVSESLGKLWMRAATAKLYLVFYIYLRHYDLSYVPEEGHVCHPWSAWVSSLLRLCLQSCCQPQDWLHLLPTWSSTSSSSSSSSPSSSSSSSSSPSIPKGVIIPDNPAAWIFWVRIRKGLRAVSIILGT